MGISCACWHLQLGWKILFRMRKPANQLSGTSLCETVFTSHLCCAMTFKCAPASTGDAQWRLNPFLHFPPKNKWKKKTKQNNFLSSTKNRFSNYVFMFRHRVRVSYYLFSVLLFLSFFRFLQNRNRAICVCVNSVCHSEREKNIWSDRRIEKKITHCWKFNYYVQFSLIVVSLCVSVSFVFFFFVCSFGLSKFKSSDFMCMYAFRTVATFFFSV